MPYDRDEVIASVTDYYNFLITHLHFQPSELKTPPPTGWPQIDQNRLAFLGKTDEAINLVQHLPYLPHGKEEKHIYDHTVCVDYTHEAIDEKQKTPELVITGYFEPEHEWVDLCPYDKFKETHEDIIVLGRPERVSACKLFQLNYKFPPNADATIAILGRQCCYIFLDTLDGEVVTWNVMEAYCASFDCAKAFFTRLRQWYEEIKLFPVPNEVAFLTEDRFDGVKDAIRSFGWPPTGEDGRGWQKEECFEEVERMIDGLR